MYNQHRIPCATTTPRELLEAGADPNTANGFGATPLHIAAEQLRGDLVTLLLDFGADPNSGLASGGGAGNTALHQIASGFRPNDGGPARWPDGGGAATAAIVRTLVARGAALEARARHGCTPLVRAAIAGNATVAAALLELGADVHAASDDGMSPIHHACQFGRAEVPRLLLAAGARPGARVRQRWNRTPLHFAVDHGHAAPVPVLVAAGADVAKRDGFGSMPHHLATERSNAPAVRALLAAGADPRARDGNGRECVHLAAQVGAVGTLVAALMPRKGWGVHKPCGLIPPPLP